MKKIGIILGSDSDLPKIKGCVETLEKFKIDFDLIFSSAHRTPEETKKWAQTAKKRGLKVIIAVAGGAAHLPGVVAASTTLPVIGIPIETKISGGLDSILSILQMPSGIPVATMPAGKAGGPNAALFAIKILALTEQKYATLLDSFRNEMKKKLKAKNDLLKKKGYQKYLKELN